MEYFFGEFLVDHHYVSPGAIITALDHQHRVRKAIGQVALESGKIGSADVLRVLNAQIKEKGEWTKFGDLAVGLGLLTADQVRELLCRQREKIPMLGSILVELGLIPADDLARALEEFGNRNA